MKASRRTGLYLALFTVFLLVLGTPASISQGVLSPHLPLDGRGLTVYGIASWYSETDPYINLHTANGEIFDDSQFTCASWDYPFHTLLQVTNLANHQSVICRVNDRGPARRLNRLIDLTKAAFREIANLGVGLIDVQVVPLTADSIFESSDR